MIAITVGSFPISWRHAQSISAGEYEWKKEYGDIQEATVWDEDLKRHRIATATENAASEKKEQDKKSAKNEIYADLGAAKKRLALPDELKADETAKILLALIQAVQDITNRTNGQPASAALPNK